MLNRQNHEKWVFRLIYAQTIRKVEDREKWRVATRNIITLPLFRGMYLDDNGYGLNKVRKKKCNPSLHQMTLIMQNTTDLDTIVDDGLSFSPELETRKITSELVIAGKPWEKL